MVETPGLESSQVYYVDAARTHELWATLEKRDDGTFFLTREAPYGSRNEHDFVLTEQKLHMSVAARFALREVEDRLRASGVRYFRLDPRTRQFVALPEPEDGASDLAYHEVPVPGAGPHGTPLPLRYHHFHRRDGRSRFQLTLPRLDLVDERYMLADLEFDYPNSTEGELTILHTRLSPGTLRHRWLNHHVELPRDGFKKLATRAEYARAFGEAWEAQQKKALTGAFGRVLETPKEEKDSAAEEEEDYENVPEVGPELARAMQSPIIRLLQATHVPPEKEGDLVESGNHAIHRFILEERKKAAPDEQYGLSLLEAALLVRVAARKDRDRQLRLEGRRVVRMVAEYERARKAWEAYGMGAKASRNGPQTA